MNNVELKHALIRREIDIAIARPSLDDDEFRSELFTTLILALPDSPATTARCAIRLADLSDQTFVLYQDQPRPSFCQSRDRRLQRRRICAGADRFSPRLPDRDQPRISRRRGGAGATKPAA